MKKYLSILLFLPTFVQAAILAPGTYQINETQTNQTKIDYTIAGSSIDNPITAFAVGFNEAPGFNNGIEPASFASDNHPFLSLPGQPESILSVDIALSAFQWDNTLLSNLPNSGNSADLVGLSPFPDLSITAKDFFGLSWSEFLAFDTSTPNYAAIFLILGGISSESPVGGFFVEGGGGTTATPTIGSGSNL